VTELDAPLGADWPRIASTDDFGDSKQLVRSVDGVEILLIRRNTDIFALQNRCSHLGRPLAGGRVMGGQIICSFHGACFDIKTGAAISGPAVSPVRHYPVRIHGGNIFVNLVQNVGTQSGPA
jgi:nitrite reductase/ring-hydroxylating ferredoxin subunit